MSDVPLRIIVTGPPKGVRWAIQLGKDDLLPPAHIDADSIVFELSVRVEGETKSGAPRFLGAVVQGPPDARFVYVNSGRRAGEVGTPWDRRAKVPLTAITKGQLASLRAGEALIARFDGRARDGGPACGTVRLPDGWRAAKVR